MGLNVVKEIDIFGPRIELRLGKKKSHKTFCGATMTIFVSLCCVIACVIIGKELIQKDNPNVTFRQIQSDEYNNPNNQELSQYGSFEKIDLLDLNLAIGIKDENGDDISQIILDSIQIQINHVQKNGSKYDKVSIPLISCKIEKLEEYLIDATNSSAYLCLDENQSLNLQLQNLWGELNDDKANYFEIRASCNNNDCKQVMQTYSKLKLHLLFKDQYFTPDSFEYPFKALYRNKFIEFSLTDGGIETKQNYDFQLQKMTVITDRGWIQAMLHKSNYLCFKDLVKSISTVDSKSLTININISTFRIVYEVNYLILLLFYILFINSQLDYQNISLDKILYKMQIQIFCKQQIFK